MSGVETAIAISAIVGAGASIYSATQKPNIKTPKAPSQIATGELLKVKTETLKEDDVKNIRETVKKSSTGNKQFQVELDKKKTGLNITSENSINI